MMNNGLCDEMDILVHKDFIGAVIGKEGANVKEIRETTQCEIRTQKEIVGDGFRMIQIKGANAPNVPKEILLKIATDSKVDLETAMRMQIRLPDGLAGFIIGKKGETINKIRQAHNTCQFKVNDHNYPGDSQGTKYMEITGNVEALIMAIEDVGSTYMEAPYWENKPQQPQNFNGRQMGGGGGMHRDDNRQNGGGMDRRRQMDRGDGGAPPQKRRRLNLDPEYDMTSMRGEVALGIPNSVIGGIIGRSGENIKYIREVSGADIQTDKREQNQSQQRELRIHGNVFELHDALGELVKMLTRP